MELSGRPRVTTTTWVPLCTTDGPLIRQGDDEVTPICCIPEDHAGLHIWWSDDGSLRIQWDDGWRIGPAEWREEEEFVEPDPPEDPDPAFHNSNHWDINTEVR